MTDAFAGVTLQAMAFETSPTFSHTPSYAPVYTAIAGTGDFSDTGLTSVFTNSTSRWGPNFGAIGGACFSQCDPTQLPDNTQTNLLISFDAPVTSVSILEFGNIYNGNYMQAYDSSNQPVGFCETGFSPQASGNYGCYSVLAGGGNEDVETQTEILASSSSGISKIIVGGYNQGDDLSTIKYTSVSAPEINPTSAASGLTLLLGGLLVLRGRHPMKLDSTSA